LGENLQNTSVHGRGVAGWLRSDGIAMCQGHGAAEQAALMQIGMFLKPNKNALKRPDGNSPAIE
jgi:hypothetical protein